MCSGFGGSRSSREEGSSWFVLLERGDDWLSEKKAVRADGWFYCDTRWLIPRPAGTVETVSKQWPIQTKLARGFCVGGFGFGC